MTQEPRENRLEALAVSTSAPDVGSPELRELNSFGLLHLFSAAHFSRQVAELERLHANEPLGKFWDELFALSTACVFCCVAGLEGYANELFVLHCDTLRQDRPQWSEDRWRKVEMKPILSKYDLATKLLKTKKVEKRNQPYLDAKLLIALRNELTHFKPEWTDQKTVRREIREMSDELQSRFEPSSFFPKEESMFPRKWAAHSCTAWAVNACVSFLDEFEARSGLSPRLTAEFRARLSP